MSISRIVTTDPSSTETVAYLVGTERIVGVSDKCDFPPVVSLLRKVVKTKLKTENLSSREIDEKVREFLRSNKELFEIDWDVIEELNPDLIVGQGLCEVCALSLRSFVNYLKMRVPKRFKVYKIFEYSPKGFLEIAEYAYKLSKVLGVEERGRELLGKFTEAYNLVKGKGYGRRIVVIEWLDPIYIAGLWISDLINASGAQTLIRPKEFGRRATLHELKEFSPDLLIISPCGFDVNRTMKEIELVYKIIDSINNIKRVYIVDSVYTANPAPRILKFASFLNSVLSNDDDLQSNDIGMRLV